MITCYSCKRNVCDDCAMKAFVSQTQHVWICIDCLKLNPNPLFRNAAQHILQQAGGQVACGCMTNT